MCIEIYAILRDSMCCIDGIYLFFSYLGSLKTIHSFLTLIEEKPEEPIDPNPEVEPGKEEEKAEEEKEKEDENKDQDATDTVNPTEDDDDSK